MSRSSKKPPVIDERLQERIKKMISTGDKRVLKVWCRRALVTEEMVGFTIGVHNGKNHVPVYITKPMVGHRLGEYAVTRNFKGHRRPTERSTALT